MLVIVWSNGETKGSGSPKWFMILLAGAGTGSDSYQWSTPWKQVMVSEARWGCDDVANDHFHILRCHQRPWPPHITSCHQRPWPPRSTSCCWQFLLSAVRLITLYFCQYSVTPMSNAGLWSCDLDTGLWLANQSLWLLWLVINAGICVTQA